MMPPGMGGMGNFDPRMSMMGMPPMSPMMGMPMGLQGGPTAPINPMMTGPSNFDTRTMMMDGGLRPDANYVAANQNASGSAINSPLRGSPAPAPVHAPEGSRLPGSTGAES
jgi:CCR4-NOT transcriptional complex subunit CAF120